MATNEDAIAIDQAKQQRLKQAYDRVQALLALRQKKLAFLQENLAIEAYAAPKFQLQEQIATEAAEIAQLEQQLEKLEQGILPDWVPNNLPLSGAIAFVGRDQDLEALDKQLQTAETLAISSVSGMGGIGKTELAWQYAHRQLTAELSPGAVCWLRAREDIGAQIVQFGQAHLGLTLPQEWDFPTRVAHCWKSLRSHNAFVVFDDVQSFEDVKPFLFPTSSRFKVLMTTRSRFGAPVQNYEIQVLSEDASLDLLRTLCVAKLPLVRDGRIDADLAGTRQLAEWLGYLPLGLELVGRYLAKKPGTAIAKVWERLQDKKLAAKALLEADPEMTALLGVAAAFELSWQELDEEAQRLAALLSLFALAEIPWSLVQACLPEADEEALEDWRDEQLVNASLLSFEGEESYQLHQLLREFFAVKRTLRGAELPQLAEDEAMKRSFCAAMSAIADQMPTDWTLSSIEQFAAAMPHLEESTTTLLDWLTDEDIYKPATRLGQFYEGQSAFGEAEEWTQKCLAIATQRLGADHPAVATSLNNLAFLYKSQGRYGEAEPLLVRSLEIRQRQLGDDHPAVATSLNNLAVLYANQGRLAEAEPLLVQALALYQKLLGSQHPDTVRTQQSLGILRQMMGQPHD
jgi:Tetratricopeptide repeat/NB-ARC domain